jgi:hypothetical protein
LRVHIGWLSHWWKLWPEIALHHLLWSLILLKLLCSLDSRSS